MYEVAFPLFKGWLLIQKDLPTPLLPDMSTRQNNNLHRERFPEVFPSSRGSCLNIISHGQVYPQIIPYMLSKITGKE
jgi:hypothetical protein